MHRVAIAYLKEYYQLDTTLLLALISARSLPLEETLTFISILHHNFINVISPPKGKDNGGQ